MFSPTSTLRHALCRDLPQKEKDHMFFPASGTGYKRAKKMCEACLDKVECRETAMSFEIPGEERYGIWGGLTARERERLAEARGLLPPEVAEAIA